MNKHYKALELDKILELLAKEISCDEGQQMALELEPGQTLFEVNLLLKETYDAHALTGRFGTPSLSGLKNISGLLRRADAGSCLSMGELLKISRVLAVIRGLKDWRKRSAGMETSLDSRFEALVPNKYVEDKINECIISDEEMSDNASHELSSIRRKIRSASTRARESLDKIIRSASFQKYLQDPIVTIRGGRFVVPVKAECRGNVSGLVHDTSASGATVFVEPMSVVEANNEIRVLLSKEEAEIHRILQSLSAEAGSFADSIIESCKAAVELSVIFGKANLAYKMKASLPIMNDEGRLYLNKARHPLIDPKKVVPTTIELGKSFDTLVITGPNTGGKTVSLKTIGLFTLMAMCGLMIPAGDNSELSVFNNILVDIGDEQSIEQSLSTFSAHITNIVGILEQADNRSLVLLDELGAGTDPIEGAALATSILEELRKKGSVIAATTHYAELKSYALNTAGVENGCCEFDVATLCPTYKLLIGVPGRSNAFAISLRLGINDSIVERAKELVSSENRQFENVVEQLEQRRQKLDESIKSANAAVVSADAAKKEAETELQKVRAEAEKEIERARKEAQNIIEKTENRAYELIYELEELKKTKQNVSGEEMAELRSKIKSLSKNSEKVKKSEADSKYSLPRLLKAGDSVLIVDIDKKATVLENQKKDSDSLLVQAGILKTRTAISNLRLIEESKVSIQRSNTRTVKANVDIKAVTEVDLRGMTAVEAIMELDNAIDSAILSKIHQITIIHGKGTGVLRKEVQNFLKHHKAIKSYRLGVFGEGESGVTIAELK